MPRTWSKTYIDSIRGLTLEILNRQLEAYTNGFLADFALTCEAMQERDDVLKNVIAKRKKAVARHGWEVLALDNSPEARAHQEALEYFYGHLRCSSVLKQNENGGFGLLVTQMMDAVAKGFAVHEIAWQPRLQPQTAPTRPAVERAGRGADQRTERATANPPSTTHNKSLLTAHLRFVPLWFFEHTTNELRIKTTPYGNATEPMDPNEWLVTVGEGVMVACARAYLFKHFPLQSWLDYCQKYGSPGLHAVTAAERDTPEWDAMTTALDQFIRELTVVTNSNEDIKLLDFKGTGAPPYIALVERMDRVMIALWRGADLGTLSRNQGYGASLQGEESRILEVDDAKLISETLNNTLDRQVIKLLFGQTVEPLAYINILVSPQDYTTQDLAIDKFLAEHGAALSQSRALQRYNRVPANPGEPLLIPLQKTWAAGYNATVPSKEVVSNY
jgi:hypothetical protein